MAARIAAGARSWPDAADAAAAPPISKPASALQQHVRPRLLLLLLLLTRLRGRHAILGGGGGGHARWAAAEAAAGCIPSRPSGAVRRRTDARGVQTLLLCAGGLEDGVEASLVYEE